MAQPETQIGVDAEDQQGGHDPRVYPSFSRGGDVLGTASWNPWMHPLEIDMSDAFLTPCPRRKAAKLCGILAIVFALTLRWLPGRHHLGIVALVQQARQAPRQAET